MQQQNLFCVRTAPAPKKQEKAPVVHNVIPGEAISTEQGFLRYQLLNIQPVIIVTHFVILLYFAPLRGHGTYVQDNELAATVSGIVERVNKLVSVKPLRSRYNGEVGDVVVGRIVEVCSFSIFPHSW